MSFYLRFRQLKLPGLNPKKCVSAAILNGVIKLDNCYIIIKTTNKLNRYIIE